MSKQKICLGTAQFGEAYGISNSFGKVLPNEVKLILSQAEISGVRLLDTAPIYGDAENQIGEALKNFKDSHFDIITKLQPIKSKKINTNDVCNIRLKFHSSLKSLDRSQIYGILVHHANDLFTDDKGLLLDFLLQLKSSGFVKKIGVSCYKPDHVIKFVNEFPIDMIQVPVNIFDQRLVSSGILAKAKTKNIEVYARSVFLQGLLLMSYSNIPSWFRPFFGYFKRFNSLASELGVSPLSLALGYVLSLSEISRVVLGVTSLAQFNEIMESSEIDIDTSKCKELRVDDENLINPLNWYK